MRVYTQEDCVQQNLPENLMNRVLVLPENETGQLFFCQKDAGDALQTVSLKTGEVTWCRKQDVMGLLRPELLPDSASFNFHRSDRQVRQIFLSIHRSIPAIVFFRMAGMLPGYGCAVQRKSGTMCRCKRTISIVC